MSSCRATNAKAAKAARIGRTRAKALSHHDFRHSRLTWWGARTTSVAGLAYQAGHKQLTTTSRYVHSPRDAARELALGTKRRKR